MLVNNIFYFDPTSPSGLRRKFDSYSGKGYTRLMASAGDVAGYVDGEYWVICVNRKQYQIHRIIMELHGYDLAGMEVDHKDGNGLNNALGNLRVVEKQTNLENQRKYRSNSSNVTGVDWHTNRKDGTTSAVARWNEDGKQRSKFFSTRKYGLLPAFKLACDARAKAVADLNASGRDYTPRHGT